jgi:hypothetical protein
MPAQVRASGDQCSIETSLILVVGCAFCFAAFFLSREGHLSHARSGMGEVHLARDFGLFGASAVSYCR